MISVALISSEQALQNSDSSGEIEPNLPEKCHSLFFQQSHCTEWANVKVCKSNTSTVF